MHEKALRWVTLALVVAAAMAFVPLWAPLVLAAWVALLSRPLLARISRLTRGRSRAAGLMIALLLLAVVIPVAIGAVSLATGAVALARSVTESDGAKNALVGVVSGGDASGVEGLREAVGSPGKIVSLLQEHGAQAAHLARTIAATATTALVGLFIFVYAVYVFLVDGERYWRWAVEHAPLSPSVTNRLGAAFAETGRGLFVSIGLTGLVQGLVATTAYFALGVPRALVLGLVTCVASIIPSVGTALVWIPVAAGLFLAGRTTPAIILVAVGVFAIGSIDNVLRPIFARYGKLELPTFVLLTSIFGGLALFGTWGLILGPLLVRLAKEALVLVREHATGEPESPPAGDP